MTATDGRLSARAAPAQTGTPPGGPGLRVLTGSGRRPPLLLVPPAGHGPRPLLVFFHGAGGRGEQSVAMVEGVAARYGLLALATTSSGSTWDLVRGSAGPDVAVLDAALAEVFAAWPVGPVAFAGFSDGASYALSLGLANGDLAPTVLAFSPGFAAPPRQVGEPRMFISHGTTDAVLPVERCGRRLARVLTDAGHDVRYEEFDGPHVLPPDRLDAAVEWWLGPSPAG